MDKTKLTVLGTVKSLRKDRKGVQLQPGKPEDWYANKFGETLNHVNIGDEVKVTYTQNGQWKNYETVEVTKKSENPVGFQKASNYNPQIAEQGDKARKSMLLAYAKDITVALINKSKDIAEANKQIDQLPVIATTLYVLLEELGNEIPTQPKVEVQKIDLGGANGSKI